jgi:small subunit ribosomal protein S6
MNRYDGLYILNLQGKDEGLKEAIDSIEKEISTLGGNVEGTQKMDKKRFERVANHLDSGFYVNVEFALAPEKLDALWQKLKLNDKVFRQFYLRKRVEVAAKPKKAKATA